MIRDLRFENGKYGLDYDHYSKKEAMKSDAKLGPEKYARDLK